jgi:hypothetical protein
VFFLGIGLSLLTRQTAHKMGFDQGIIFIGKGKFGLKGYVEVLFDGKKR